MKARYWPCNSVKRGGSEGIDTRCPWVVRLHSLLERWMPTNVRHRVTLTAEETQDLRALVAGGTARVRHVKRAQVLLAAHAQRTDEAIGGRGRRARAP